MKDMIIAFGLTTAVFAGVVYYYRKKNKEQNWVGTEENEPKPFFVDKELGIVGIPEGTNHEQKRQFFEEIAREKGGLTIKHGPITEDLKKEFGIVGPLEEPLSPTEGFQGLPDKVSIEEIAEKAIKNYKPKKYPARRRKKRSGK